MATYSHHKKTGFVQRHSLSLASAGLILFWIIAYAASDPNTRWGSFFGNAIADWSGSLALILGTKFFFESGSAESRAVQGHLANPWLDLLRRHSLLLLLALTGLGWILLYTHVDPQSRWGQVVGSIVSEWVQMGGLVFFTKRLVERGSKESH